MTWHRFRASSDDDNECVNPSCGVIVSDDALNLYANPCPAPACTDPGNVGPCVFVPGDRGPECAYCSTGGCKDRGIEDDDDEEEPWDVLSSTAGAA